MSSPVLVWLRSQLFLSWYLFIGLEWEWKKSVANICLVIKGKAKSLDREDVVGIRKRTRLCTCRKSNEIFTTFFYTNYLQTWLYDSFCEALYKSLRMDVVWALSSALNIHRRWKLSSLKMETFYHLLYTLDELKYFKSILYTPCLLLVTQHAWVLRKD